MLSTRAMARWLGLGQRWIALGFLGVIAHLPAQTNSPATNVVELIAVQGTVEIARAGQSVWDLASTNAAYRRLYPGDQLRTLERSRATVRLADRTLVELGPNAHFRRLPEGERQPGFGLLRGLLHLFHRDRPDQFYFRTPTASPVIRGTEFNLEVAEDGTTTLHLFEGAVSLTNELGALELDGFGAAIVPPHRRPQRTAALEAVDVIQWCLYYPAVLNLDELPLGAAEQAALAESLAAYRRGDLLGALAKYPRERRPASEWEKVYLAALLLSVGSVADAEAELQSTGVSDARVGELAGALRVLVAAVKHQPMPAHAAAPLSSVALAESYHHQSRYALAEALAAARRAVAVAPGFAFGWARVAELEFSFGRTRAADLAVKRALELAPRHAQALAVNGFLLAGENQTRAALAQFDAALAADNALGNAWLGRGLCRLRQGRAREGVDDLLVAAALEPNRALLRSYLGKGFEVVNDFARAGRELHRARQLDPNDPTAWLYAALLNQQHSRVNEAVRDLERSLALNDQRQLYRSRLLLDQDRAVRQANLAAIYRDAGLPEESLRAAGRAVGGDYANAAAHLFLANSFAARGGASPVHLRDETAMFSEYFLAQLMAPVGGTVLSPHVSQQEYSRLFERRGFGVSSATEYLSRGDWRQRGVQFGVFDRFDYALEAYYDSRAGERPNHDSELRTWSAAVRMQLSPRDTVFVQAVDMDFSSGDLRQLQDPAAADPALRLAESQSPNLFAGFHHEWSPEAHTLFAAAWLNDEFQLTTPRMTIENLRWAFIDGVDSIFDVEPSGSVQFSNHQRAAFDAVSLELQQVWRRGRHTWVLGGRGQAGETESRLALSQLPVVFAIPMPPLDQEFSTGLRRANGYVYDHWQVGDDLLLLGGVSFDWLDYPDNIDLPPFNPSQRQARQWSPKAGLVWSPTASTLLRAAYARSLGGLYYDQSVRLEPAQWAGFAQSFRTVLPTSLGGLLAGAEFEVADGELSWRGRHGTYLSLGGEWRRSRGERTVGVVDSSLDYNVTTPSGTPQTVAFEEAALTAGAHQLLGARWALGARYRFSRAQLAQQMPGVIAALSRFTDGRLEAARFADQRDEGWLHQLELSAQFSHECGFFARAQALWFGQENRGTPDEAFGQVNLLAGWRFARRRAELSAGLLNLGNQDYRLNPVNETAELPRERTFLLRFKFNF